MNPSDHHTIDGEIDALLRSSPRETFPEDRLAVVIAHARRDARLSGWNRLVQAFRTFALPDLRPALAMASLLAVVLSAALVGRTPPGQDSIASGPVAEPSVEEALAQVKWTLAYLSDVGRDTGRTVRDDVLAPHVVTPIRHAVDRAISEQPN